MRTSTNVLLMPIAILGIEVSNNSDWLDGLEYWSSEDENADPLDLTGIDFDLNLRSSPPVATVMLRASTYNGLIKVYANTWQLLVPATMMKTVLTGDYVFDMLARADGYTRNIVQATVTVIQGVTRTDPPAPRGSTRAINGTIATVTA